MSWKTILFLSAIFCLVSACSSERAGNNFLFEELNSKIEAGDYGEITSLLIWQGGEFVQEEYYRGNDQDSLIQVYSVTKSVISILTGIAVHTGDIAGADQSFVAYLPQAASLTEPDERLASISSISIEDLLTMQAGFEWDELSTIYGNPQNDTTHLTRSDDWTAYMLGREIVSEPGESFAYNSGVSFLLGVTLAESAEEAVPQFADRELFDPLGIERWEWETTPDGYVNGGWGLFLQPKDMLSLGRLYLNEGEWNGEQIVSAEWVAASSVAQASAGPDYDYGYQWWRFSDTNPIVNDLEKNDLFFAWGFGGNFIFVVPHLDLVVVATAENFENSTQFFPALSEHIFPQYQ